jgi:hypothetical protein
MCNVARSAGGWDTSCVSGSLGSRHFASEWRPHVHVVSSGCLQCHSDISLEETYSDIRLQFVSSLMIIFIR